MANRSDNLSQPRSYQKALTDTHDISKILPPQTNRWRNASLIRMFPILHQTRRGYQWLDLSFQGASPQALLELKSPIVRVATLTENVLYGEDPLSFIWDGKHCVLNHFRNNYNTPVQVAEDGTAKFETKLPDFLGDKHTTPVPVSGKGLILSDFEAVRHEVGSGSHIYWSHSDLSEFMDKQ